MMKAVWVLILLMAVGIAASAGQLPTMPVSLILEQQYRNDSLAMFNPERLEFTCESSSAEPWGFSFAGFETRWTGPIELEVRGSGGYQVNDIFSVAGISLDYSGKSGWIERSLFGLGLIQASRAPHPPSWGVGSNGKFIMRGNLVNAETTPRRIVLDPAKYAPAGWDGRLWIGLVLHNVGAGKTLNVRITNALPPSGQVGPTLDRKAGMNLLREHQQAYLRWRMAEYKDSLGEVRRLKSSVRIAATMKPYAPDILHSDDSSIEQIAKAISDAEREPIDAGRFTNLVGGDYRPNSTALATARAQDRTAAVLNGALDEWRESGRFGKEIGCIIRAASNLEKVGLTDLSAGRIISANSQPIRISAARHEYEGFQVILTPLPGCAKKVTLTVSDLKAKGGTIPASNVTVNPVGYVRILPDGRPTEMLVPDPLLIGAIPELAPGENQPVWITVRVPDDAPAGEYAGSILIGAEHASPLRLPFVVKVRNFAIPRKFSLRSSFWVFRDQLNRFYHLDEISFDDYMKWIDFALEHRLCPIDVYEGRCRPMLDIGRETGVKGEQVPNPTPDFTLWDRYIDRMVAGGASTIHLGQSHHQGTFFSDRQHPISSPVQVQRVVGNLAILREHLKSKGVFDLHYLQLRDETSAPDSLNVYRDVGKEMPDVKLLLTAPSGDARPLLQIPCPLTPGFDPGWQGEVKSKGGEYWWYVCCAPRDPAWANLFLEQTAAQHRALFWQTWRNGVDGILYWGMNFWSWYQSEWPANYTGPTQRVQPKGYSNFCSVPGAPGDGFSMYPGPSPSQPMSSIRLEIMRDGEEDYEYLRMLDRLIEKAEPAGGNGAVLTRARRARRDARLLVPGLTDYKKTGAPYLDVREEIGDAIEELMGR